MVLRVIVSKRIKYDCIGEIFTDNCSCSGNIIFDRLVLCSRTFTSVFIYAVCYIVASNQENIRYSKFLDKMLQHCLDKVCRWITSISCPRRWLFSKRPSSPAVVRDRIFIDINLVWGGSTICIKHGIGMQIADDSNSDTEDISNGHSCRLHF